MSYTHKYNKMTARVHIVSMHFSLTKSINIIFAIKSVCRSFGLSVIRASQGRKEKSTGYCMNQVILIFNQVISFWGLRDSRTDIKKGSSHLRVFCCIFTFTFEFPIGNFCLQANWSLIIHLKVSFSSVYTFLSFFFLISDLVCTSLYLFKGPTLSEVCGCHSTDWRKQVQFWHQPMCVSQIPQS